MSVCRFVKGNVCPKIRTLFCLVDIQKRSFLTSCVFRFMFSLVGVLTSKSSSRLNITSSHGPSQQQLDLKQVLVNTDTAPPALPTALQAPPPPPPSSSPPWPGIVSRAVKRGFQQKAETRVVSLVSALLKEESL